MIKTSFAVKYKVGHTTHVVAGVTAIVPNLNGVLMFTKDGENHFIESCDLRHGILPNMYIDYDEDYPDSESLAYDSRYKFHDHRKK